ncbi:uncharacterized protein ACLA_028240 [Aspergillus clavatus NRRL 1]|uniref:Uncharacterized protein n=1 Tax=Aspergillus clavatus (strain ATCC 1007 / CBS 513.65 / DSM 816 / NCTC 3887 / NRRL 1 / QM 1276 / 107) TaxID=344612 RepID=A1CR28_ASPCL|nr:uncharacterized protein ACLA_028240 [Aspergillus clavatus NRRL 1]EAW08099.1 hypothetical protein ACLA_028240 [Aspergillus clavatus NRRL 1]
MAVRRNPHPFFGLLEPDFGGAIAGADYRMNTYTSLRAPQALKHVCRQPVCIRQFSSGPPPNKTPSAQANETTSPSGEKPLPASQNKSGSIPETKTKFTGGKAASTVDGNKASSVHEQESTLTGEKETPSADVVDSSSTGRNVKKGTSAASHALPRNRARSFASVRLGPLGSKTTRYGEL